MFASLGGLEPPSFQLTAERANQLRHRDIVNVNINVFVFNSLIRTSERHSAKVVTLNAPLLTQLCKKCLTSRETTQTQN